MTRDIYTLEIPRDENISPLPRVHNPAVILAASLLYALAATLSNNAYSLLAASILPSALILTKRIKPSSLAKLNAINAVMILTLVLTWPKAKDGLIMGVIIALRVNMIYITFSAMVYPLGTWGIYEALCVFGVPENLRVLLILTLRGINVLHERYVSSIISARLRAPDIRGLMRLKVFAFILGNVLIQSLERGDNMMRAVKCRGGFAGFMQAEKRGIDSEDIACVTGFAVYGIIIAVMNYA